MHQTTSLPGLTAATLLALTSMGCGSEPQDHHVDDAITASRVEHPQLSCVAPGDATAVSGVDVLPSIIALPVHPPYKVNDQGNECGLVAKYNGDISAGLDPSAGSYADFKACIGSCLTATSFSCSKVCVDLMMACQEKLVGAPFKTDMNIANPTSDTTWNNFLN